MSAAATTTCDDNSINCTNELHCGVVSKTRVDEEEVHSADTLLLWSWFLVAAVVLLGFVSNLIVIHAVCCVKHFHRSKIVIFVVLKKSLE